MSSETRSRAAHGSKNFPTMNLEDLKKCPDWPASMDVETAVLYLGGKASKLFRLIYNGHLEPDSVGNRSTEFLRSDIDLALQRSKLNRLAAEQGAAVPDRALPEGIKSVAKAVEARKQLLCELAV